MASDRVGTTPAHDTEIGLSSGDRCSGPGVCGGEAGSDSASAWAHDRAPGEAVQPPPGGDTMTATSATIEVWAIAGYATAR